MTNELRRYYAAGYHIFKKEVDEYNEAICLNADVKKLEDENERLREALADMLGWQSLAPQKVIDAARTTLNREQEKQP